MHMQAPPPRRSLIEFDDNDDPEELERLEQERIQRSMKNLYSHARTVRRCLQYATKVLDRYDVSGSGREGGGRDCVDNGMNFILVMMI
jgi:hypothetical protein